VVSIFFRPMFPLFSRTNGNFSFRVRSQFMAIALVFKGIRLLISVPPLHNRLTGRVEMCDGGALVHVLPEETDVKF